MKKRILAVLLTVLMLFSLIPVTVSAASPSDGKLLQGTSGIHANPLYPDISSGTLHFPAGEFSPSAASDSHFGSLQEVAEEIRAHMIARDESFTVYLHHVSPDGTDVIDEINAASEEAFDLALEHTGNPVEGDYLKWHWDEWINQWGASSSGNGYNVTIDFVVSYYTTAEQEREMDTAFNSLLDALDLEEESDYRKIQGIYDYLCENVTYDHENLNNQNYTLKFTAYAALVNGTAVCQGYASLFYRLALALGVDTRLIAGDSGGPHAWNIAQLNDLYYNLDSTWDAGMSEYRYFLVNDANFTDHTRYGEYDTEAFHAAYPMSPTDFDPQTSIPHTHSYTAEVTPPTCTLEGYTTHTCTCGDTYTDSPTAALGHTWDEGTVSLEPTETEPGLMTFTCLLCGQTDTKTVPSLNHEHSYEAVIVPPTCTADGYTLYACTGCDDLFSDNPIPALGHQAVIDSALSPTCTATGLTEGSHCHVCGSVLTPQQVIPATGHQPGPWTVTLEPTGKAEGMETRSCICGLTEQRLIPRLPNPFHDVKDADYFFEPVLWAVSKGITTGMSATSFGPGSSCTRAQVVTFLWRAAGEPEPVAQDNPFSDVKASDYFYNAVLWAVERGITTGISATSFGPNSPCTRAQVVTFLHRSAECPAPDTQSSPFTDVNQSDYFSNAVLWAVENGITTGTGNGRFSPGQTCTRAQVVTFLYRANH